MKTFKAIFIAIILLLGYQNMKSQSISVSGGGTWTLDAGATTHDFRFWISYDYQGLQTSSLHYKVDGGSLVPSNPVGDNSNNPSYVDISLGEGNHSIEFIWYGYNWQTLTWYTVDTETKSSTVKFNVYVTNIFGGGNVSIDSQTSSSGSAKTVMSGNSIGIGAIEQSYGGYNWVWSTSGNYTSQWTRAKYQNSPAFLTSSQSTSYSVASDDNATTLEAGLRKVCNITFSSSSGYVYVNSTQYSSPKEVDVVEQNTVTAQGTWYYSNGLEYTFDHWDNNPSSNTITATQHQTYTAVNTAKPSNSGKYAGCSGNVNNPIIITWTDNINSAVDQYEIRRKVKHNGVWGSVVSLTTVGRGVQSYTDYDYVWTDGYTDDLIQYDVREYYGSAYSDEDWVTAYGRENANIQSQNGQLLNNAKEIPDEYSISNFPNPFNPTTTISYQLPQSGFVTIKVYDMIGKEVATLVNDYKSPGYHSVNFDANKLTSGVYIYTINANNFILSKKMILMK